MFKIARPDEPGVYDLNLFEGEEIASVTFCNLEGDSLNIVTATGKLIVFAADDAGKIAIAVVDISDIADQLPN